MTTQTKPRAATWPERCTWGQCPACSAPHGEPCDSAADAEWFGLPGQIGAHRVRLNLAPVMVRSVLEAA